MHITPQRKAILLWLAKRYGAGEAVPRLERLIAARRAAVKRMMRDG